MFCEFDNCRKIVANLNIVVDCRKIVCEFGPWCPQTESNRNVFRSRRNESVDRSSFSSVGSLFHAATEKALSPIRRRVHGTTKLPHYNLQQSKIAEWGHDARHQWYTGWDKTRCTASKAAVLCRHLRNFKTVVHLFMSVINLSAFQNVGAPVDKSGVLSLRWECLSPENLWFFRWK